MKTKAALLALVLTAPCSLFAESRSDAFLVKANFITVDGNRSIATGGATLTGGDTRVTADEIVFDQPNGILRFTGAVTVQVAGMRIETKEAILATDGKRVFLLSNGRISRPGVQRVEAKVDEPVLLHFTAPFPKTETELRRTIR